MNIHIDIEKLLPVFDSRSEAWWHEYGTLILADHLQVGIVLMQYHPVTFSLPGGTYTPDFLHVTADGHIIIVEIKGSKRQHNYRDARSKLRAAADLYRWATFFEAIVSGGVCSSLEEIVP